MKPASDASGVRSSWLALARKSVRVPVDLHGLGVVAKGQKDQPVAFAGDRRQAKGLGVPDAILGPA